MITPLNAYLLALVIALSLTVLALQLRLRSHRKNFTAVEGYANTFKDLGEHWQKVAIETAAQRDRALAACDRALAQATETQKMLNEALAMLREVKR